MVDKTGAVRMLVKKVDTFKAIPKGLHWHGDLIHIVVMQQYVVSEDGAKQEWKDVPIVFEE
jgi:hypothetical protein